MLVWQLVLIQMATFVLIILFLRWLFYSHISRALRRLQQLNQQNLEKEKVLKEEIERAKRQTEREIQQGRIEAESIKEKAREDAEKETRRIIEVSRKEAKRIINEGIKDSQRKYNDLLIQMQDKAVNLSTDIIRYIFTEQGQKSLQTQLLNELITEIDRLGEEKLKAKGKNAEVISVFPLENEQKTRLKKVLSSKLNKDITLTEQEDKEIIAGLIIRLGGFVIDGSIKNKLKKILPLLKEKAKE